jgi:hypothetical protein
MDVSCGSEVAVVVHIHSSSEYAEEIQWQVDEGNLAPAASQPYEENNDYFETVCLPEGSHTFSFIDSYEDGWGQGAYWELSRGGSVFAGGPDAVVEGAGGIEEFSLEADGMATGADMQAINVRIVTASGAQNVRWNIDGGEDLPQRGSPYADDSDNTVAVQLSDGLHLLYVFGRRTGWNGGYYEITDAATGAVLAGGATDGVVEGDGGEVSFCTGPCGATPATAGASITVHIQTSEWAEEVRWNIDDGDMAPCADGCADSGPYADNTAYDETLSLPVGVHPIAFFDTFGDGWAGAPRPPPPPAPRHTHFYLGTWAQLIF